MIRFSSKKFTDSSLEHLNSSGVYLITHISVNNAEGYVGATKSKFRVRWKNHFAYLTKGQHYSKKLQNLVDKFGFEGLRFNVLEIVSEESLMDDRERFWIEKLESFKKNYNHHSGGKSNFKVSNSLRVKLRDSSGMKGKVGSEHHLSKNVYQYDLEGNFIAQYESTREAGRLSGIDRTGICLAIKKEHLQQYKGFQWFCNFQGLKIAPIRKLAKQHKKVKQIDMANGNIVNVFASVTDAAKYVGAQTTNISKACRYNKVCKGFKWTYLD